MPSCAVLQCRNKSSYVNLRSGGISYHRFPKSPKIKEKWIDATGRRDWFPTKCSVICSKHFHQKDFTLKKKGNKYLKKTAVPVYDVLFFQTQNPQIQKTMAEVEVKIESCSTATLSDDDEDLSEVEESKVQAWPIQEAHASTTQAKRPIISDSDTDSNNLEASSNLEKTVEDLLDMKGGPSEDRERLVKKLRGQNCRLEKKIEKIDDVFKALEKECFLSLEIVDYLRNTDVQVSDLVSHHTRTIQSGASLQQEYTPELCAFAHSLYYYSPMAYEYVRSTFNSCLPLPTTVRKWNLKTGGEPGFTKEALTALKHKADRSRTPILAALVIDTMDLRQNTEVHNGRLYGYIDMGTGLEGDCLPEVKCAMVFMVTAVNKSFKVPVGYFLIDEMRGEQRAELVKQCIELVYEAGIKIVSLTMDGYLTNLSMAKALGCSFETGDVKFEHPITKFPIVAIIDLRHIVEHIHLTFLASKTFIDREGNKICWRYLEELTKLKDSEIHLFKEPRHLDYHNQRVKVKLATQPFSLSVAEAMKYCRVNLNMLKFKHSEATEQFLILMNNVLDIFNSRNIRDEGYKKALTKQNSKTIFDYLTFVCDYIIFLKLEDQTPLIKSPRKTGFLGLLGCVEALKSLSCFVQERIILQLPIHRLSQNHLKLLFDNIRSQSGTNQDPTSRQFVAAYNKLLNNINVASAGTQKYVTLEKLSFLNCPTAVERINRSGGLDLRQEDSQDDMEKEVSELLEKHKEFNSHTLGHIVCFIVQILMKKINCNVCVQALVSKQNCLLYNFVVARDRRGVFYPSADVITLCNSTETVIRSFDLHFPRNLIMIRTLKSLIGKRVFDSINDHQVTEYPSSNHVIDLMKAIIESYMNIRIHNIKTDFRYQVRLLFQPLL